ncbi:MAG: M20/M25/M40 family metallo-hydrolase [bacterium]
MKKKFTCCLLFAFILPILLFGQEPVDLQMVMKIKNEGFDRSQVMETLGYMTEVIGPRLAGSPSYKAAAEWCRDKLAEWGLENAHLEVWGTFGQGWELEKFSLEMIEPQYLPLISFPKAWIPSTNGTITGTPILVEAQSEEQLEKYKGKLQNAIVLTQAEQEIDTYFEPEATRYDDKRLSEILQAPVAGQRPSRFANREEFMRRRAMMQSMDKLFRDEGVAVILEPSRGADGTLFVSRGGSYRMNAEPSIPSVVVAAEHYNRIVRLLKRKEPVTLAVNIQTKFFTQDSLGYNVIAEIPGVDKKWKDELVMLGGHLDSWHGATGAVDNAAGCAVSMEAVRILMALGVKPKRTIRVALWDAEEEGLLGSRGYVTKHFADRRTMELKPEHAKLSGYFNYDNGTGKIRGIYLQGNDAIRPIFEAYLKPFHDLGATTVTIRNTGGTDHQSFDGVGLPGFQFIQDPIDYSQRRHHTNMDVYDHAIEADLMQSSVIMASFVYHTAMRDEMLPRKTLPEARGERRRPF